MNALARMMVRAGPLATAPVRCVSTSPALRAALAPSASVLQKKKAGGSSGPATPAFEEKYDLKKQIPVNLLKEGDEPEYKPLSEYPEWVAKLADEKPLLEDFIMKGLENVEEDKMKQVFRMANKRRIKEGNDRRRTAA